MFVAQLWRHPVKSLAGERLDRAVVTPEGVEGDRAYAVCDAEGEPISAKRVPRLLYASATWTGTGAAVTLPGDGTYEAGDPALDAALTGWLGQPVSVRRAGPYFDSRPLHVLTTESLREAALRHPAGDWDPRRFRMNVLVEAGEVEDGWTAVSIGAVGIEVAKRTVRCSMTTVGQPGLDADPEILRSLPDKFLGVYATVARPGTIRPGDRVVAG